MRLLFLAEAELEELAEEQVWDEQKRGNRHYEHHRVTRVKIAAHWLLTY